MKKLSYFIIATLVVLIEIFAVKALPVNAATPSVKKKVTIYLPKTYQININDLKENAEVTYSSENLNVAMVNEAGEITPTWVGTTNIVVKIKQNSKSYTRTIKVTVKKPYITTPEINLLVSETQKIKIKGAKGIRFKSADEDVATVSKKGTVTAVGAGETWIDIIGDDGCHYECKVIVKIDEVKMAAALETAVNMNYVKNCAGIAESVVRSGIQPGESLFLGYYEQDGDLSNGTEDIEWIVLDRSGRTL